MSRPWVHALLFVTTFVTAALAGGGFWEGGMFTVDGGGALAWGLEGLPYATALLAILGAHEMGHYVACRRYGVPATLPFFLPSFPPLGTFGAVIRIRAPIPHRRALFDIAAAGPIAGFVVALPVLIAGVASAHPTPPGMEEAGGIFLGPPLLSTLLAHWLHGSADLQVGSLYGAGWAGMLVTSMNLFPVGQLDGGHAAYALSRRLHRILAWITIGALGVFVAWVALADREVSPYALWLAILGLMRDRHPPVLFETGPLGRTRLLIALGLLLLFAVSFIPVPFRLVEP